MFVLLPSATKDGVTYSEGARVRASKRVGTLTGRMMDADARTAAAIEAAYLAIEATGRQVALPMIPTSVNPDHIELVR